MKHKTDKKNTPNKQVVKSSSANKSQTTNESALTKWLIVIGLIITTALVFYPMLQNQFTSWDDQDYVTSNFKIWNLDAAKIKVIFTEPIAYNYHPLTMLSLGINYSISQLNPYSYYLTNMLLHLLNVALVFWFVYLLSNENIHVAIFTALIFGIHPMHVESVAWAAERKDVLYTFFFVAGLITWLIYLDTKKQLFYAVTFLLALCSMLSKPAAIIFPLLIMVIEYYRNGNFEFKSVNNKIPFFILAAFFMYMTLIAQTQETAVVGDFKTYNIIQRFSFASYGFIIYLVKFFVPYQLATFHPYPKTIGIFIYASPLLIIALLAGIYFSKEYRKLLIFGLLFYLVNLVLVLQFFSIGSAVFAERYTYVPYIGIAFCIGMILFNSNLKLNKNMVWGVVAICCIALAYSAHARVKVWHTSETLWTDMIEKYPENDRGYYDRGNYYSEKMEYEKAIADFNTAIKVGTDYKSYTNRGLAFVKLGKYEEALKDFNYSLQLDPLQKEGYIGRSHAYFDLKRYDEALKDVNVSINNKPTYEAMFLRGSIYKAMQKYPEAIADYTQAASMNPDVSVYNNRGNVYFQMQNYQQAIADYNVVLNQNPNDVNATSNRGAAYLQSGKFDYAIADFNKAVSLDPNSARHYANLAFLYEKKGDKSKALENANKAIKLGFNFGQDFIDRISR